MMSGKITRRGLLRGTTAIVAGLHVMPGIVRMAGADYTAHGIKYQPALNLLQVDAAATLDRVARMAERQAGSLAGLASLAYDTPGYGYGQKDEDGTPLLQTGMARIAATSAPSNSSSR